MLSCSPFMECPLHVSVSIVHRTLPWEVQLHNLLFSSSTPDNFPFTHKCCANIYFFSGKKVHYRDYILMSKTSSPSQSLEWINKQMVYEHFKNGKLVNIAHLAFTNSNHVSLLISFHDTMIRPKAQRNAVDTLYFHYSESFRKYFHELLVKQNGYSCAE